MRDTVFIHRDNFLSGYAPTFASMGSHFEVNLRLRLAGPVLKELYYASAKNSELMHTKIEILCFSSIAICAINAMIGYL